MKSIIIICPYFGTLPMTIMPLWLKSVSFNPSINWMIITDDTTKYDYPQNVSVIYSTLKETKIRFQKHFDFPISLERPYKLCDYKPAYGLLFSDYVKDYDYWGYCDLGDTIFGDIRKFLNDAVNANPDKIMYLGHLTIYRNDAENNRRFLLQTKDKKHGVEEVLSVNSSCIFDEIGPYSIHSIYRDNDFIEIRLDSSYIDISPMRYSFSRSVYNRDFMHAIDYSRRIIAWENGKLFDYVIKAGKVCKSEIGYVHFQKRKMECFGDLSNASEFLIVPNGFVEWVVPTINVIKKYSKNKLIYKPYFRIKYMYLKSKVKRIKKQIRSRLTG